MANTLPTSYTLLIAGTLIAWLASIVIYRLFLHPLAKIPGPKLAAITTWHECYYDVFKGGKHPWKLKEMHEKYGPIIRPIPNQVHISDPEYLDVIYAVRNRNNPVSGGLMIEKSMGCAEFFPLHKTRRDALNAYFSLKAVVTLEPLLVSKRDEVVVSLHKAMSSGQPINLSDLFFAYANDIVRCYCFGSDNGLLHDLPEAKNQRENLARLLQGVNFMKHFKWLVDIMSAVLPLIKGEGAIPPAVTDMIEFRRKAGLDIEAVLADKSNDHKGRQRSIFYELRDSTILPPEEKTHQRLQDEATLLVMAGTESTTKSLAIAVFYLLWVPETMTKLRREIREAQREVSDKKLPLNVLLGLPYLCAVIHEANRLSFGVTGPSVRYSPSETLTYTASYGPHEGTTYVLPPGTRMATVTYCTHTNETLFPDP